ncbi:MAG: ABC transporter substrate-binding protein, partial [Chloroflexota bacterium]
MSVQPVHAKLLGGVLALGLLVILACGPSEKVTPTPTLPRPTPTVAQVPLPVLPTATPTPTPVPPGVTAVPQPTATPTSTPTLLPGEKPIYGGTVTMGVQTQTLLNEVEGSTWGWFAPNLYNQLVRVSPVDRMTVEGDLAESWSVSADGLVWKFKIRPGVKDHEGNTFNVQDAYWEMVRYMERPGSIPVQRQTCLRIYVKRIWDAAGKVIPEPGAEITGPDELTVRLLAARGAFVGCFSNSWVNFAPSKYTKAIDTAPGGKYRDIDPKKGEVVGTGPFKLKAIELDNYVTMERFGQYFRTGKPYLDSIKILVIPDGNTRVAAYRVGRIDHGPTATDAMSKSDADKLKEQVGDELVFAPTVALGWRGLNLNVRRPPFGPLGDPKADKIRWAMQISVDRHKMNLLIGDGIGFLSTPYFIGWSWIYTPDEWVKGFRGFDSTPDVKAKDIAEAQRLMQE